MIRSLLLQVLTLFYPLAKKWLPFEVYAYLASGAINTAFNILVFALLYQVFPVQIVFTPAGLNMASYTLCLLIAFAATVPTGFWLAKNLAFRQSNNNGNARQLVKYFLVVLQGLLTDYLLMLAMINLLHFHPTVAKVVSTIIVLSFNYLLQKYFTFKPMKVGG